MEKVGANISGARRNVNVLLTTARWIWVVNSLVMIAGVWYQRYDVAAVAGFTWILSLFAAAFGHRAVEYLGAEERAQRQ